MRCPSLVESAHKITTILCLSVFHKMWSLPTVTAEVTTWKLLPPWKQKKETLFQERPISNGWTSIFVCLPQMTCQLWPSVMFILWKEKHSFHISLFSGIHSAKILLPKCSVVKKNATYAWIWWSWYCGCPLDLKNIQTALVSKKYFWHKTNVSIICWEMIFFSCPVRCLVEFCLCRRKRRTHPPI